MFFIYLLLIIISGKRYIVFLPTISIYPDNEKEALEVLTQTKLRNIHDINFFKLTNRSVSEAFTKLLPIPVSELDNMITSMPISFIILFFKYSINRARPYQINSSIDYLHSNTGNTPAFPAGHALQAYYLAKTLGKKYPGLQSQLDDLAEKCDSCRIKAGIHYPSDGKFSKQLVDIFFPK